MAATFIWILIALLCAKVCHTVAIKHGANAKFWAIMGGTFGPLAIPFSFFSRRKKAM